MTRLERLVFFGVPLAVLAAAYAGICLMTGTIWPWNAVVHEDGARTLASTVFYFEHATRELLPDIVLAMAVAGAARLCFSPARTPAVLAWRNRLAWIAGGAVVSIVGATLWADGAAVLVDNLSQSHTRPGAPLIWGAHWRYHLLERLAQVLLAPALVYAAWALRGRPATNAPGGSRLYAVTLVLFVVITAVAGWTAEPFTDPAYLGHQLRELFTHGLVTLPLAMGVCLALSERARADRAGAAARAAWPFVVAGLAAIACGTFLLVASVMSDAQSHGQTNGLAALLLPHFGEHFLGYVLTPALAGAIYAASGVSRLPQRTQL